MSKQLFKEIIFIFLLFSKIINISNYPILPTILTLSIPISDEDNSRTRVENNYVRWLQASGADLISVHPWTSTEEIDFLLKKVNGILFQGNPHNLDIQSPYYKIAKYLYKKTIEMNDSGIKMPIIAFGDDLPLLCSIIAEDKISIISELKYQIHEPSKINLFNVPDKTIILNEFEREDMDALEKEYILPNNLKRIVSLKDFLTDFHLGQKFNVIATSKTKNGKDYIAIAESRKYPIILMSFHPEYVVFEQNKDFIIPETLRSIYTSRFIGNGFVFFGRKYLNNTFTVEEKEKYGYIDPYGPFPKLLEGRYNYIFEKESKDNNN